MKQFKQKGFTLLELMMVLAIASILSAIAIPSMRAAFSSNDISAISSDMVSSLQLARLEAVKRISKTTVAANGTGDDASWKKGFVVSQQINISGSYQDSKLKVAEAPNAGIQFTSATSSTSIAFDSRGYADQAHTIEICDASDKSIEGRRVVVAASGHVTSEVYNCNS